MSVAVLRKPGADPRVVALAERIRAGQAPEIATLKGWLGEWGRPTSMPTSGSSGSGAAGTGSSGTGAAGVGSTDSGAGSEHSLDGMMSAADVAQLESADAPTASKLFLSQMVQHHEGAVRMAQTEKSSGRYLGAVAMAGSIVDSQTLEIDEMKSLLAGM